MGILTEHRKKVFTFFSEVVKEMRKVVWPTRGDVVVTGILVLILSMMCSVYLFIVDRVVLFTLQWIMGGAHG